MCASNRRPIASAMRPLRDGRDADARRRRCRAQGAATSHHRRRRGAATDERLGGDGGASPAVLDAKPRRADQHGEGDARQDPRHPRRDASRPTSLLEQIPPSPVPLGTKNIRFRVTSPRDGYLVLLSVSNEGEVVQLFPNALSEKHAKDGRIRARQPRHRSGSFLRHPVRCNLCDEGHCSRPRCSRSFEIVEELPHAQDRRDPARGGERESPARACRKPRETRER